MWAVGPRDEGPLWPVCVAWAAGRLPVTGASALVSAWLKHGYNIEGVRKAQKHESGRWGRSGEDIGLGGILSLQFRKSICVEFPAR
jgi:hypothetical protein